MYLEKLFRRHTAGKTEQFFSLAIRLYFWRVSRFHSTIMLTVIACVISDTVSRIREV
uniref:Uncharacterized protein n=1 Tax=Anguilla anguilla TaxID=7936 RepID=A0A0E9WVL9_ANGAN